MDFLNVFFDVYELRESKVLDDLPTVNLSRKTIRVSDGSLPLFNVVLINTTQNLLFEALDKNAKFFVIKFKHLEGADPVIGPNGWLCYCNQRRLREAAIVFLLPVWQGPNGLILHDILSYPSHEECKTILDRVQKIYENGKAVEAYKPSGLSSLDTYIKFCTKALDANYTDLFFLESCIYFGSSEFREKCNPYTDTFIKDGWEDVITSLGIHEKAIEKAVIDSKRGNFIAKRFEEAEDAATDYDAAFSKIADRVPEGVAKIFKLEQKKLGYSSPASPDYAKGLEYLDTILSIPWGIYSKNEVSIKDLGARMDASHYGMQLCKSSILEHLAVQIKAGTSYGEVICLIGPPGVGKSSIANVLAQSMGRKFIRIALGGVGDESILRGHKRTYIGSESGRLISELIKCGTMDPVIVLDEVDKLDKYRGSPVDALLEILDPEQNDHFMDHFLNFPVDLSRALFICTANYIDQIPAPLRDRMTFIDVEGYTFDEQKVIARDYVIPKFIKKFNLEGVTISDDLIELFCSRGKGGVRAIEKAVKGILKKAALKMLRDGEEVVNVSAANCTDIINFDPSLYVIKEERKPAGFGNG